MKLEFFEDAVDGGPMILLYGGGPKEVALLRSAMRALSESVGGEFAPNDLQFGQSVDRCRLRAISSLADLGVTARASGDFEWTLSPEFLHTIVVLSHGNLA